MKRALLQAILISGLSLAAANAQVYVRVGPPPPPREVVTVRPGPQYVWVQGYQQWNGRRYVWVPGRWVVPPRRYRNWKPGRWEQTRRGYIWRDGRWR